MNDSRFTLSDLDLISPNTLVTSFLVYKTHPNIDQKRVIESVTSGLQRAAEQLPTLGAQIQFKSSGKPQRQMIKGDLRLKTRTFELWEHKSFEELAEKNFMPTEFQQARLIPVESYDKTGVRPVLLAQLSLIPGGMILALGLNHVVCDGGARNLAIKLICESSKAYMTGEPAQRTRFDYDRDLLSAKANLLTLPRKELQERVTDYAIFDPKLIPQLPPGGFPHSKAAIYRIEGSAVNRLKDSCRPIQGARYLSSYDCIVALLWRSVMRARCEVKPHLRDSKSRTLCPIDLRKRGIGDSYFGNAVTVAKTESLHMKHLLDQDGLSRAASTIRRAIENTSVDSLAEATALGKMLDPAERMQFRPHNGLLEGDFMLSNWHFMDTTKFDFGIGPPAAVRLPAMPAPGFTFVFPDCQRKPRSRVYDVYMTLPDAEHDILERNEEFRAYFRSTS